MTQAHYEISPFPVNYESVMFYSTAPSLTESSANKHARLLRYCINVLCSKVHGGGLLLLFYDESAHFWNNVLFIDKLINLDDSTFLSSLL
jgi:hypothetical protein